MPIAPRPEQVRAFAAQAAEQAYGLYAEGVLKTVAALGGRPVFHGRCETLLIGDGALAWDAAAIVEYPSLEAFQQMTASPEYAAVHVHREAGLAHQLLVHCRAPR